LTIKDNGNVSYATTGTNLLVASDPAAPSNTVHTFTVSWSMPTVAGNSYEGATASLTLTAHAVQSANNGAITGCTAGSECDTTSPGVGAPSWS
jgi:hypothetical protein